MVANIGPQSVHKIRRLLYVDLSPEFNNEPGSSATQPLCVCIFKWPRVKVPVQCLSVLQVRCLSAYLQITNPGHWSRYFSRVTDSAHL